MLTILSHQANAASTQSLSYTRLRAERNISPQWVYESWKTSNDKSFLNADQTLRSYIRAGKDTGLLVPTYQALTKSRNPKFLNAYRWGMSLYYSSKTKPRTWHPQSVDQLLVVLKSLPLSHSSCFDRMRFLVEATYAPNFYLKPLALRLLTKYPHDDEIKYSILPSLNIMGDVSDGQLALRLMKGLVAKHPNDARSYSRLGAVYYDISIRTNTRNDSLNAIVAYKEYLERAKPNDPFYDRAKYLISVLQRDLPVK